MIFAQLYIFGMIVRLKILHHVIWLNLCRAHNNIMEHLTNQNEVLRISDFCHFFTQHTDGYATL